MIVKPGAVIDFLLANQNAKDPYQIDWSKVTSTYSLFLATVTSKFSYLLLCPGKEDAEESEDQGQPFK